MQKFTLTSADQVMLLHFNAGQGLSTNWAFVLREVVTLKDIKVLSSWPQKLPQQTRQAKTQTC